MDLPDGYNSGLQKTSGGAILGLVGESSDLFYF